MPKKVRKKSKMKIGTILKNAKTFKINPHALTEMRPCFIVVENKLYLITNLPQATLLFFTISL